MRRMTAKRSRPEMAPQRFEKIESAPGNGMGSDASNLQHLVRERAADEGAPRELRSWPQILFGEVVGEGHVSGAIEGEAKARSRWGAARLAAAGLAAARVAKVRGDLRRLPDPEVAEKGA
jgi:hypothetical protein